MFHMFYMTWRAVLSFVVIPPCHQQVALVDRNRRRLSLNLKDAPAASDTGTLTGQRTFVMSQQPLATVGTCSLHAQVLALSI